MPSAAPLEPLLHPGTVLLLKPLSGVFDTVSRSHLDRSRMAARLKSRLALDLGVGALSSLDLPRADGEGARERAPRKGSKLRITKSVPLDPRKRTRGRGVPR